MTVRIDAVIPMNVSVSDNVFELDAGTPQEISLGVAAAIRPIAAEHYHGTYTVTPSAQTQTLQTAGLMMESDVIVEPIPSNYGLITWNGSTLTVS